MKGEPIDEDSIYIVDWATDCALIIFTEVLIKKNQTDKSHLKIYEQIKVVFDLLQINGHPTSFWKMFQSWENSHWYVDI